VINNKTAKECLSIIWQAFEGNQTAAIIMLSELAKIKGNQSFHDSMQLLLDLAKAQRNKE
jgi:hypothetical protein